MNSSLGGPWKWILRYDKSINIVPHLTQCQMAYTDEQEDDELFEFNGFSTINNTNNRVIVYMHAGIFDLPAEDSSDDEAEEASPW